MNTIFKKLRETSKKPPLSRAGLADNGVSSVTSHKDSTRNTQRKDHDEDKAQKQFEKDAMERLRTISIRIPLLFFGGDFELKEGCLADIITNIDDASWKVFMPEKLTKADFKSLVKYYNQETVIGAAKVIRAQAMAADELPPTERVKAITDIFAHFHNPSKETVLTPWRVVNMHISGTLGGWCFYDEKFTENDDEYYRRLQEPRFVDRGAVTAETLANPNAQILEINSKSGLYPLYVTYSLYRAKLGVKKEQELLPDALLGYWDEAVRQVFVLCQSPMAESITKRTLVGYRTVETSVKHDDRLLENIKTSLKRTAKKISKGAYWDKEVAYLKFEIKTRYLIQSTAA